MSVACFPPNNTINICNALAQVAVVLYKAKFSKTIFTRLQQLVAARDLSATAPPSNSFRRYNRDPPRPPHPPLKPTLALSLALTLCPRTLAGLPRGWGQRVGQIVRARWDWDYRHELLVIGTDC